jgi:hypothetical protein
MVFCNLKIEEMRMTAQIIGSHFLKQGLFGGR